MPRRTRRTHPENDPYEVHGEEPCAVLGRPELVMHEPGHRVGVTSSTYVATVNEGVFRTFQIQHAGTGRQVNVRLRPAPTGYTGGQAAWEVAAQATFIAALDATHSSGVPNAAHILFNAR